MEYRTEIATNKLAFDIQEGILNGVKVLGTELMDAKWFYMLIDAILEHDKITFENQKAKSYFVNVAISKINKKFYNVIFPDIYMDSKGKYTKNYTKWV